MLETPEWVAAILPAPGTRLLRDEAMDLAKEVALASARNGGGPFGAVVVDGEGRIVDVGWNAVVASRDSTAHAEVVAIRRAERRLGTWDLSTPRGLELHASAAPCIMCFGAIWWSGLKRLASAATREDAEAAGFVEGPVAPALWEAARRERGIVHEAGFRRDDAALAPFREFLRSGVHYRPG